MALLNFNGDFMIKMNRPLKHGTMRSSIRFQCKCFKCLAVKKDVQVQFATYTAQWKL